jgi:hypothetical protein
MKINNLYKIILGSGFILLIIIMVPVYQTLGNSTDPATGTVTLTGAANDPPMIVDFYEPVSIVSANENVTFFCLLYDLDNSSNELNVTLFYSVNSFATVNNSVNLTFNYSPETDYYRFDYEIAGQPPNTLWQFYYMAYDGETRVYEPTNYVSGDFLWIQWILVEYSSYIDVPNEWNPFGIFSGIGIWFMDQGWIIVVGLIVLFFLWRAIERAAS